MVTLNLFTFNNYYNRTIQRYQTLDGYTENGQLLFVYQDRNFNPNDGVSTTAIFNYTGTQPDYCIVTNTSGDIQSRWFVMQAVRTTGGQYKVSLYRDLVSDYYSVAINSPAFIQKAKLGIGDPAIFNSQDMTFNQIRKAPQLLYDKSKTAWVVGYIPRDAFAQSATVSTPAYIEKQADIQVDGIQNWQYKDYTDVTKSYALQSNTKLYLDADYAFGVGGYYFPMGAYIQLKRCKLDLSSSTTVQGKDYKFENVVRQLKYSQIVQTNNTPGTRKIFGSLSRVYSGSNSINDYWYTLQGNMQLIQSRCNTLSNFQTRVTQAGMGLNSQFIVDSSAISTMKRLQGQVIKDTSTGKIYRVRLVSSSNYRNKLLQEGQALTNMVQDALSTNFYIDAWQKEFGDIRYGQSGLPPFWYQESYYAPPSANTLSVQKQFQVYRLQLKELNKIVKVDISDTNTRQHLRDASYDMFCIPVGGDLVAVMQNEREIVCQSGFAQNLATAIAAQTGSASVYDIQLLPYCPIQQTLRQGRIDLKTLSYDIIYYTQQNRPYYIGVMLWCDSSSFQLSIPLTIQTASTSIQKKVNSLTKFCRLCSPNGAGMFQFTPQKNGGVVQLQVNCTYKPFQPFIQVKPKFGQLYGVNSETDYRGLICGGDFSLTQLSNQWANYQQNNSNYQAIFDRQIQNLEVTQTVQRVNQIYSAGTSLVSGAATGAMTGGVAGAVAGGLMSAANSAVNIASNQILRRQALDYRQDLFGFQLGNIKAIPTSISKTSALVITNPLVPYIEYYDCTQVQKQALIDKITYNGMTVGRIGRINDFLWEQPTYVKAKLIRAIGLRDDYHIATALADQLNKGVFI